MNCLESVSTHSRPKAAGAYALHLLQRPPVSTHSRPKAAGRALRQKTAAEWSFNSQPPEGGWKKKGTSHRRLQRFNSQPPEGGWTQHKLYEIFGVMFQLTAARRRLGYFVRWIFEDNGVSTHSRPKAAGRPLCWINPKQQCFNSQPPEGGW